MCEKVERLMCRGFAVECTCIHLSFCKPDVLR